MRTRYAIVLASFLLPACSSPAPVAGDKASVTVEEESLTHGGEGWFVLRPDQRKCAAPMCGGYFVERVNRAKITCLDGKQHSECYVAAIDWAATQYSDEQRAKLAATPNVFHGRLIDGGYAMGTFANLSVADVWSPATPPTLSNGYLTVDETLYRAYDNGIRCITTPCPSTSDAVLNTTVTHKIGNVDLSLSSANDKQKGEGYDAVGTATGVLVDGYEDWTYDGKNWVRELSGLNFYLQVQATPTQKSCGGFVGGGCADGQYCDITIANACSGADLPGVCKDVPEVCNQIYLPVCGCDNKTYGNDCERVMARVQLDHAGACETAK